MGKYTHLRHQLPAFRQAADEGMRAWFAKVDAWKQEFLGTDSGENANATRIAAAYADRDFKKKALEAEISQLNIELEGLSQLGVEAMESDGVEKSNLAAGGYVGIKDTPYTSVADRAAIFRWIKRNKMQELLTMNYQTLSAITNERLVAGKPLIPGTKVFMKTKLTVRGVNGDRGNDE
jgi:hypothetical protein